VDAYCLDKQLDSTRIKDKTPQSKCFFNVDYEMRLPEVEGSHDADMSIEPISPSRLLSDNLFDALILLRKEQSTQRKFPIEYIQTSDKLNPLGN
jgi:hypothetical protein